MKKIFYFILNLFSPINLINTKDNLRVLAYHDVKNTKKFEDQLRYLFKSGYTVIGITDLKEHIFRDKKLPRRSVFLTFDDGDVSVLDYGLPLLKKYNMPSVMFIITSLIDSENTFWCRWVEKELQNQGKSYTESRLVVNKLKKISNTERVAYLKQLEPIGTRQLTTDDILMMQSEEMFIGNHTHTHPMVDKCSSKELNEDLKLSKASFDKWRLPGAEIFAYPNGNWDKKSEDILKYNGVKMAFLFDHKLNRKEINPMRISRIRVNSDTELNEFKVKVSGLHSKLMTLKNRIV